MAKGVQRRRSDLQRIPAMLCGLYRTTVPMRGHADHLGPDQLVMLHDHRPESMPYVLFPARNEDNQWVFEDDPHTAEDADFLLGLVSLRPEGYYVVAHDLALSDDPDHKLAERSLVMVGYTRQGRVLLFPARFQGLTVQFATEGYPFDPDDVLDALTPANFDVPTDGDDRTVH
ncbi:MAG: hypothetical protein EXR79_08315 [Myxococcales bacterium]|nr:hypothetical protein [Myxococcales bacterium]